MSRCGQLKVRIHTCKIAGQGMNTLKDANGTARGQHQTLSVLRRLWTVLVTEITYQPVEHVAEPRRAFVSNDLPGNHVALLILRPLDGVSSGARSVMSLRLYDVTFCQKCLHWVKVTAVGLCTCGAVLSAAPSAGAAPSTSGPAHHLWYVPDTGGDSEPFHPAEPDQTFDGPAAIYSATVATSRPVRLLRYGSGSGSRRYNGGAVSTS
jgi:hypothetical protein